MGMHDDIWDLVQRDRDDEHDTPEAPLPTAEELLEALPQEMRDDYLLRFLKAAERSNSYRQGQDADIGSACVGIYGEMLGLHE